MYDCKLLHRLIYTICSAPHLSKSPVCFYELVTLNLSPLSFFTGRKDSSYLRRDSFLRLTHGVARWVTCGQVTPRTLSVTYVPGLFVTCTRFVPAWWVTCPQVTSRKKLKCVLFPPPRFFAMLRMTIGEEIATNLRQAGNDRLVI